MANGSFEVSPGTFMAASCHHRKRAQMGACGACYARLIVALERVEKAPTIADVKFICEETSAAMRAEKPAPRGSRKAA